jgi:hypothetical protein
MKFNYKKGSGTKPGKPKIKRVPFDYKPFNLNNIPFVHERNTNIDSLIQAALNNAIKDGKERYKLFNEGSNYND